MSLPCFAVIFAIITKVCRVFCHFCRDFLLSLPMATNVVVVVVVVLLLLFLGLLSSDFQFPKAN